MKAPAAIAVVDSVTATDIAQLAEVLVDCVAGGASVSFMPPFEHEDGKAFFTKVADEVARGETALLVARVGGRPISPTAPTSRSSWCTGARAGAASA